MTDPVKFAVIELDMHHITKQNVWLTFIASIGLLFIYYLTYGWPTHFSISAILLNILLFVVLYIVLIVLHEICHLIGFVLFGRVPFSSLRYGLNLKLGVAYATTTELLPNYVMRKALLLPFWVTGVIPVIIGFAVQNVAVVLVGAWLIAGAIGDFAMYTALLKYPKNCLVKDDEKFPRLHLYSLKPLQAEKKDTTL